MRLLGVTLGAAAALGGAAWSLLTALRDTIGLVRSPGRASVEELVIAMSAAAALVLLLWVTTGLLASVVATLPGPLGELSARMRDTIAPQAVRRWAALLLGVAVVSACAPGAAVASEVRSVRTLDHSAASPAPAPLWLEPAQVSADSAPAPEWTPPPIRAQPPVTLTASRPAAEDQAIEVTVRRGDTLWDLAAAYLSPDATDAEVATAWQQWHAENRDVIGPDPDLILPGQVLTVPVAESLPAGGSR
ncbi:MAG: LysM peptidoglycan-binding domain-containing protein [Dermatophilaceae bacterium]